jgi:pyruvate dehydrogenase E2 component (dihydrolipoamide acetyltransferase)
VATEVLVPPLGQTVDTVTLVSWYKEEGEVVAQGETLFAIETDKATLDIEAPASGVLRHVTAQPGDEVQVLSAIALITAPDEVVRETTHGAGREPVDQEGVSAAWPDREKGDGQGRDGQRRILISPRARRLAEEHGIPLEVLQATGPEGAIIERDVRVYVQTQRDVPDARTVPAGTPSALQVAEAGEAVATEREVLVTLPVQGVRAVIAERLLQSSTTTAHVTLNAEADATELGELRQRLLRDGIEVSYNDLLLYILGRALRDHPQLNASLEEDRIKVWRQIHIGLAVDTDRGLLVPVVRDVDRKGLGQLAGATQSLVERARAGQCTPEELRGATFTLTNLGMFGIDSFTPIINLPECAVLGVGRIKKRPAVVGDQVVVRQMVWLSLTFDHRLVDGAPAARFLQRVVQMIEGPHLLML